MKLIALRWGVCKATFLFLHLLLLETMGKEKEHKAGFVSIIGKPNVGKSTLMNRLVGGPLSIVTRKAQTTRHRIRGIVSGEDFQIVYSDTPGVIDPKYQLHKTMMRFVETSLEDADMILLIIEIGEKYDPGNEIYNKISSLNIPLILIINKIDKTDGIKLKEAVYHWDEKFNANAIVPVSALKGQNTDHLLEVIKEYLPEHPPYFPKDEITDKPERFFASEIIREKIFMNYKQEIPYSTEVAVVSFKEEDDIIRISAEIYVEKKSQKGILIGKGGEALKKVGIEARKDLEEFFGKHIYLETYVKIETDWRKRKDKLKRFGYQ